MWLVWSGQTVAHTTTSSVSPPTRLGLWTGTPLPVEPRTVDILETEDVALMEYRLGEEPPVWFARVSGFGNRAAFHPPELCFVGSRFEVLERNVQTVLVQGQQRRVMRLVIGRQGKRFEAWYWFTANGRVTPSYYQQQLWLVIDSIRRQPMSGTLVRISTPYQGAEATRRRLLTFLSFFDATTASGAHG